MIRRAFVDLRETFILPILNELHGRACAGKKSPQSDRVRTQNEIYQMFGLAASLKAQLDTFPEIFKKDLGGKAPGAGEEEEGGDVVDTAGITDDVLLKIGKLMGAVA
jgi:hypothetical protein